MNVVHDVTPALHGDALDARFRTALEGAYPYLAVLRKRGAVGGVRTAIADAAVSLRIAAAAS